MAIKQLGNVPMIPQDFDGTCWFACARMVFEWSVNARGSACGMVNPTSDSNMSDMNDNNRALPYDQVYILKDWTNMKKRNVTWDFDGVSYALKYYGALWVAGYKGYYHVQAVVGVADTGVLVHDPEPVGRGTRAWKTWSSIQSFVTARSDIDINVLSCP